MAYFSGIGVHKDGFQVAHEQRVHVQLLARAVHGNEIEMGIEFGEVEDFPGSAQPARCADRNRSASGQIRSSGLKAAGRTAAEIAVEGPIRNSRRAGSLALHAEFRVTLVTADQRHADSVGKLPINKLLCETSSWTTR